ncbi:LPXTG cell wall anchor domain-containing protein, partial [Aerococcus sp. HMSC061A03]
KKEAAKKAKSTLPKTGAIASATPAVLGLALASAGTALVFGKKKEDK